PPLDGFLPSPPMVLRSCEGIVNDGRSVLASCGGLHWTRDEHRRAAADQGSLAGPRRTLRPAGGFDRSRLLVHVLPEIGWEWGGRGRRQQAVAQVFGRRGFCPRA